MSKRTVIPAKVIEEIMIASLNSDIIAYFTKSAAWMYNKRNGLLKLVVLDSKGMTNDVIYYDPSCKHYETHKRRILKLAA